MPWGCAPRASPRSWRPPRAPLRASTAASPPPRTTSPTPSLVSAVLHRALAPACVRKCARVSLCTLLCPGGQGSARTCARAVPGASAAGANLRAPTSRSHSPSIHAQPGSRFAGSRRAAPFSISLALLMHYSCTGCPAASPAAPPLVHAPHRPLRRLRQRAVDLPRCIRRLHGPAR